MANFLASNLVQAQALVNAQFNSPELRAQQTPILNLGNKNTETLIPSHKTLIGREDRPLEAYIVKRTRRDATGKTRAYRHTGDFGDSEAVDILFAPFADTFKMSLKLLDNNMYDSVAMLANKLSQSCMNIRESIEAYLADWLMAQKTQVNVATQNGTWNGTTHAFEIISLLERGLLFEDAKSMMRQNFYTGGYDVIADPKMYRDAAYYANQGAGNASNLAFQFSGMSVVESVTISDTNYSQGMALFLPTNSFGVLNWIPPANIAGYGSDMHSYNGFLSTFVDPVTGMTYALSAYEDRADTSSVNGNAQDFVMEFELSVDVSPVLAPLSTANESVVFQVARV